MRWVLVTVTLTLAGFALAANPKATALAKDAERLYKDGKYREAADALKDAYELEPISKFVYNRARALDQAGELNAALDTYRQYVALPSDDTDPELVKKANLAMDRIRTVVAKQEADKKLRDAEKKKLEDDAKRAQERAEQEAEKAKRQREDYEAKEQATRIASQRTVSGRKLAAFITGGVAVVGLGLGIGLGVAANGAKASFIQATTLQDKLGFEASTRGLALGADIGFVVALAGAVTAVILFPKGAEDAQQSVSVALMPLAGGGFATLGGRF